MCAARADIGSALFGTKGQIGVNRGLAEFHARRPVLITGDGETLLALPVEGLDAQRLAEFVTLCAPAAPRLVITARRAFALGLAATTPVALQLTENYGVDTILALVADAKTDCVLDSMPAGPAAAAAIQLAKLSQGLPAVLAANVTAEAAVAFESQIIAVEAEAVARFDDDAIRDSADSGNAARCHRIHLGLDRCSPSLPQDLGTAGALRAKWRANSRTDGRQGPHHHRHRAGATHVWL